MHHGIGHIPYSWDTLPPLGYPTLQDTHPQNTYPPTSDLGPVQTCSLEDLSLSPPLELASGGGHRSGQYIFYFNAFLVISHSITHPRLTWRPIVFQCSIDIVQKLVSISRDIIHAAGIYLSVC